MIGRLSSTVLLALVASAVSACRGPTRYTTPNRAWIAGDPRPGTITALAREARWIFHRRTDGDDRYYCDVVTRKKLESRESAAVVFPKAVETTAELLYQRTDKRSAERAMKEHELYQSATRAASFSMTALHLMSPMLASVSDADNQMIEALLASSLRGPGLISDRAPEGSILHISIAYDTRESKVFTGRQSTAAVALVLEFPGRTIGSSGRQLVDRRYTGNVPANAPDGFAALEDELEEVEAEGRDLRLLLESAALELMVAINQ